MNCQGHLESSAGSACGSAHFFEKIKLPALLPGFAPYRRNGRAWMRPFPAP
ncbi:hypothetical protein BSIN_3674 [Burkholderia singularis]|uniref:Uncharacterized protein n=1 Tax=Burkholderia singularis TaxID=1503053 RepID=A0A238H672_9BURK|nr:hypothetical protein BSIN_3674 [Burkholderia singularis]